MPMFLAMGAMSQRGDTAALLHAMRALKSRIAKR